MDEKKRKKHKEIIKECLTFYALLISDSIAFFVRDN